MQKVKKRNGKIVDYDDHKILEAVRKANRDSKDAKMTIPELYDIVRRVEVKLDSIAVPNVERVQDTVEDVLMNNGRQATAKAYIIYRAEHAKARDAQAGLMEKFMDLTFKPAEEMESRRDNANIDTNTPMGTMLKYGTESSNYFNDNFIIPKKYVDAHRSGRIHIHDKDFQNLTFNCTKGTTGIVLRRDGKTFGTTMSYFDEFFFGDSEQVVNVEEHNIEIMSTGGKFVNLKRASRKLPTDQMYKLTTSNGIELSFCEKHIFPVIRDGKQVDIELNDVNIGDQLVMAEYNNYRTLKTLNLVDKFGATSAITISNSNLIYDKFEDKVLKKKAYAKLKADGIFKDGIKARCITLKEYHSIRDILNLNEEELQLTAFSGRGKNSISAKLDLTYELGKICGYIASEGSFNGIGHTLFSNKDEVLIKDFVSSVEKCFTGLKITVDDEDKTGTANCSIVHVFGQSFRMLFDGILLKQQNSLNIELCDIFDNANIDFLKGFFEAMIDGDGCVDCAGSRIQFLGSCKKIIKQMQIVLSTLNIATVFSVDNIKGTKTTINGIETKRNSDAYRLSISKQALIKFTNLFSSKKMINSNFVSKMSIAPRCNEIFVKDKIIEAYDGYVYDIETEDHYFNADGILVHNCLQIDLPKLLHGGFSTGHGFIREPQSIRSYAALACIAIQSSQNDMYGGQSICTFDYAMAEGVRKSFRKLFISSFEELIEIENVPDDTVDKLKNLTLPTYLNESAIPKLIDDLGGAKYEKLVKAAYRVACKRIVKETYQAMESVIHNLNSMHSRAGAQVPFSSINFGTDTSPEGRLVMEQFMLSEEKGLGHGETPIFPKMLGAHKAVTTVAVKNLVNL